MCHPAPMQSGLVSEIERMEPYLRLCLRAKSVPGISALARDAAWASSEAARIKKTSRRSEVRDDSAYLDSGNGGLGSSLTTIQLLNVNLRSASGQGACHNLRLCCHRGFSLRGAPHPRRHSLCGALRLLV